AGDVGGAHHVVEVDALVLPERRGEHALAVHLHLAGRGQALHVGAADDPLDRDVQPLVLEVAELAGERDLRRLLRIAHRPDLHLRHLGWRLGGRGGGRGGRRAGRRGRGGGGRRRRGRLGGRRRGGGGRGRGRRGGRRGRG